MVLANVADIHPCLTVFCRTFIGYTKEIWNGDPTTAPTFTPTTQPTMTIDGLTDNTTTVDSTSEEQVEAVVTPEQPVTHDDNQDDDDEVPADVGPDYYEDYWWSELPPKIQDAAGTNSKGGEIRLSRPFLHFY